MESSVQTETNAFRIRYNAYRSVCMKRFNECDTLLLGVLTDLHPVDNEGNYIPGSVSISIENLWKRRMLDVPSNLAGITVEIIY